MTPTSTTTSSIMLGQKNLTRHIGVPLLTLLLASTAMVHSGCSVGDDSESQESVGTLRLPLTATSTSGATYQLLGGTLEVTGTETATLSTNDYINQTEIVQQLLVGTYQINLADGWVLEKVENGVGTPVDANLISENPVPFAITDQASTPVQFVFQAGDDVIPMGNGNLIVSLIVQDTSSVPEDTQVTCTDGLDNDLDGGTDCADPDCSAFCQTGMSQLWSHVDSSITARLVAALPDGNLAFAIPGGDLGILDGASGLLITSGPAGLATPNFADLAVAPNGDLIVGGIGQGNGEVIRVHTPGLGMVFKQGPFPNTSPLRVSSSTSGDTFYAYSDSTSVRATLLDLNGIELWTRALSVPGQVVEVSDLGANYGVLTSDGAAFSLVVVDPTSLIVSQNTIPVAGGMDVLGLSATANSEVGVYVSDATAPLLERREFDALGSSLGGTQFNLSSSGPVAQVATSDGGLTGVWSTDGTLGVYDSAGNELASLTIDPTIVYSDLTFLSPSVLCAGGRLGGQAVVDCYNF